MWTAITNVPSMREFINFERFTNFFQPRTLIPSFPHRSKFIGVAVRSYATCFPFSSLTRKPKSMSMALSDILQRKREVFPCVSTWKYLQNPRIPQEHKFGRVDIFTSHRRQIKEAMPVHGMLRPLLLISRRRCSHREW